MYILFGFNNFNLLLCLVHHFCFLFLLVCCFVAPTYFCKNMTSSCIYYNEIISGQETYTQRASDNEGNKHKSSRSVSCSHVLPPARAD